MEPRDHYQTLSLPRGASPDQIRGRFRELVRERHPDCFQGVERAQAEIEFQKISEAFQILANPERRRQHDLELSRPAAATTGSDSLRLVRFHLEAGMGFYRDGNFWGASEAFDQVLRLDPKNHSAWHHLALALCTQKAYLPRAVEAAVRACELNPVNADYQKLAGRLHSEAGLFDKAEQYYNGAKAWGGDDPVVEKALDELRGRMKKRKPGLFDRGH